MATLYTIGHGARSAGELVALLKEAGIGTLVDGAGILLCGVVRSSRARI